MVERLRSSSRLVSTVFIITVVSRSLPATDPPHKPLQPAVCNQPVRFLRDAGLGSGSASSPSASFVSRGVEEVGLRWSATWLWLTSHDAPVSAPYGQAALFCGKTLYDPARRLCSQLSTLYICTPLPVSCARHRIHIRFQDVCRVLVLRPLLQKVRVCL